MEFKLDTEEDFKEIRNGDITILNVYAPSTRRKNLQNSKEK